MALVHCRECGELISELAPTCPKCGAPMCAVAQQNQPQSENIVRDKVDIFISSHSELLPGEMLPAIRNRLLSLDVDKISQLNAIPMKDPVVALLLSIFLGQLGVDRFYIGSVGAGVLKLLTLGFLGLWWFIDLFLIMGKTKKRNAAKLASVI